MRSDSIPKLEISDTTLQHQFRPTDRKIYILILNFIFGMRSAETAPLSGQNLPKNSTKALLTVFFSRIRLRAKFWAQKILGKKGLYSK